ncbi:MAG: histidine phosphatase family protein, partial [Candidatus Limnocylindria bacterium]
MSGRRLLLVRHGVTDWNREGRFQGHLDPPLADDGVAEASLLGARLAADGDLRPVRIISSTLARAFETARAIGTAVGVEVEPDARLIEIGQGEWEGRTHGELAETDADRYAAWRNDAGIRQPPGGEALDLATRRVTDLLAAIDEVDAAGPICLVSHGGTLRILARAVFGRDVEAPWSFDVDNASLSVCSELGPSEGWRLERWNDTMHLLGSMDTHVDEAEGRPLAL